MAIVAILEHQAIVDQAFLDIQDILVQAVLVIVAGLELAVIQVQEYLDIQAIAVQLALADLAATQELMEQVAHLALVDILAQV